MTCAHCRGPSRSFEAPGGEAIKALQICIACGFSPRHCTCPAAPQPAPPPKGVPG